MHRLLLFFGLALVIAGWGVVAPTHADIYSWKDEKGVMHFSNEPPPTGTEATREAEIQHDAAQYDKWQEARDSAQKKMLRQSRSDARQGRNSAVGGRGATRRPGKVVMFTTPTCPHCIRAKKFFQQHKIQYAEVDITASREARQRYEANNGNGVPLILVGKQRIPGFNEPLLRRMFGIRTAQPRP